MLKPGGYLVVVDWAKRLECWPRRSLMLDPDALTEMATTDNLKLVDKFYRRISLFINL